MSGYHHTQEWEYHASIGPYLYFKHEGSNYHHSTIAKTARIGLMYWLASMKEHLGEEYNQVWSDGSNELMPCCLAMAYRYFGQIVPMIGETREERALNFLKWMRVNGNVKELRINGELM